MFSHVVRVESTGSTNSDLIRALSDNPDAWSHLSVLVAESQTAGRGRNGNVWVSPPGQALTCSVVLEPGLVPVTWVPLAVGIAAADALRRWVPARLKWPNDLVLDEPPASWGFGRKVGGILCEVHPSGSVVAGIGINCLQREDNLPVPWAASLSGVITDAPQPREVLHELGVALAAVWDAWAADPAAVRARYAELSAVLGREVDVSFPGGESRRGLVAGFDDDGALLLTSFGGTERVMAGDVMGIRP